MTDGNAVEESWIKPSKGQYVCVPFTVYKTAKMKECVLIADNNSLAWES